ncbi:DUF1236 domain-containing protein [Rhizobium sp. BK251]|uniref:DUF1236 domain-containing protein n=1 Tax=Rhizobium sp. BK251 TaxID=2512125 RepID=UPI0010494201|nr:DUF1236 domain-containing protein [Rhizobium sp. BK251]TCL66396.1 uncharacterized protein DUF1236 [Rhizobium sp. BK251]
MKLIALTTAAFVVAAGGSASAQTTTVVTVPGEVRTYVTQQDVPSVVYDGDVVVGSQLPASVEIHTIPTSETYSYTVVNKHRLIVDPQTRRVIEVLE